MDTPIIDFVKEYSNGNYTRLHMPGHKGKAFVGLENLDITEFDGADCLYNASGIIKQSRENASSLFGANTFYSTEGSSLCIRAMLYLALKNRKDINCKPFILAGRNAHKTFVSTLGLLDIDVKWIYPEKNDGYLSCSISADKLEKALLSCEYMPIAVYITSPDYLGNVTNVKELSLVCKKYGVLLLVDNAHGAYLKFLPQSQHPIDLGADMCCDSAHKTLPALTGSAYLHLSKKISKKILSQVEYALSIFGSTSPSYLILQSLDAVNKYISDGYKDHLQNFISNLDLLKQELLTKGYTLYGNEPLKITICTKRYGYTGVQLNKILNQNGVFVEFYDCDFLVMMFTPQTASDLEKIKNILLSIPRKKMIDNKIPALNQDDRLINVRKALLANTEKLPLKKCLNKTFAELAMNCPPAVPIVACGEIIDQEAIDCLKYYGVKECTVIKE